MKFKSDKQRKAVMSKMQDKNGSSSASPKSISSIRKTYYHGTTNINKDVLIQEGIKTAKSQEDEAPPFMKGHFVKSDQSNPNYTYVFSDYKDAETWGKVVAHTDQQKSTSAVVKVELSDDEIERDTKMNFGVAWKHKGNISADRVSDK